MSDTSVSGATPSWQTKNTNLNAVFTDGSEKNVNVDDFLTLMVAQLKNQDFMNPVDDTQYVTQLAQFATMQQMQEMAYNSKSSFMLSLVGKDVTVAKLSIGGKMDKVTAPVDKISFVGNDFRIIVAGKEYQLSQIMEIHDPNKTIDEHQANPAKLAISATDVLRDSAKIKWQVPTTDEEIAKGLKYSVYYSTDTNFSTVDEVKKGTLVGISEEREFTETDLTGLEPGTTYFVNVVVKDANGKEAVYQKGVFTTPN